ncbi:MAG TPA: TlpA disulfide reductase family protein [Anaeromyxobacteraceae bacterium]|jgi:thiol-disulfide isomerase/thioredoxin|nr:TlpA disulfide reductase family protein [Anaeromyxobacteraceae bacterium]
MSESGASEPAVEAPLARRSKPWLAVAAAVGLAVAAVIGWQVYATRAPRVTPVPAQLGLLATDLPAPPFRVQAANGAPVALPDVAGQVTLVHFWATWCPPCREELPALVRLGRELEARYPGKFKLLAISVDESWDAVQQFFAASGPPGVLVARDLDGSAMQAYFCGARGACPKNFQFPESYVVDAHGRLVAYVPDALNWSEPAARDYLEKLIRG